VSTQLKRQKKNQTPLKEKLTMLILKGLSHLPLPVNRFLGRIIGHLAWLFANKQRHFALTNLHHCFLEKKEEQIRKLAKASIISSGELLTELAIIWLSPLSKREKIPMEVEGFEYLQQAYDKGKGVILLLPHLGNWEMMPQYILCHYPFSAMYKPARLKVLNKIIKSNREKDGASLYPASTRGIKQILKAIKSGVVTAILPDQEPAKNAGIFAPFFNQPAWTMTLAARIYQKTAAEMLAACILRTSSGFKLVIKPIRGIHSNDNIEKLASTINLSMEQLISLAPEQYQWSYKRFYTQPHNQPQIYLHQK